MYVKGAETTVLHIEKLRCIRRINSARLKLKQYLIAIYWLGTLLFSVGALAGIESDPTEPPPEWLALQPATPGPTAKTPAAPTEVQVLIIGRSKKLAVINGQIVRVGDENEGSKVLAVRTDQVVTEDVSKSLLVTPSVKKQKPVLNYARKKNVIVTPISEETAKAAGTKQ